ncbi:DUF2202 domain-containing protein [Phycicoccus sp. M110.8]|uniref:DUF2202 domain-containing protein n=1 Tax=Phycicoccus sp. M110.8 TaxID=3075433 RepID=UPI0028FD0669|nr:DUF2202 domain-containing protein [Phycicoccus sp. M110.8]MDU0315341.1 DUF2202 domain-containing protein [Phycicoccus sp. M110.8]
MTLRRITTTALSVALAGTAVLGFTHSTTAQAAGAGTTSQSAGTTGLSAGQLTQLREEERMARDLYTRLASSSGEQLFVRIATAEQRHLDSVEALMRGRGMDPAAAGTSAGTYAVPALQAAYDRWLARGTASDQAAYAVGVELEKRDIADLRSLAVPTGDSAYRVVSALLAGSEHHLTAFTKAVNGQLPTGAAGYGRMQARGQGTMARDGSCATDGTPMGPGPGANGNGGRGQGMRWSG